MSSERLYRVTVEGIGEGEPEITYSMSATDVHLDVVKGIRETTRSEDKYKTFEPDRAGDYFVLTAHGRQLPKRVEG